ncbi:DUF5694 domain-containing protein [Salimicrobium flavidum]|uniref:TraB family protein n=1 Tax=Salimicrobium flavidum TaxID=570947 RepID=A0A1N7K1X1_9BACI|nr:DUF5694 domain-containing protein [Salimicrobium flavidum]SIS55592.1 hypothetical protein SAMN05421687_108143 [Salimicrobium flavidum]
MKKEIILVGTFHFEQEEEITKKTETEVEEFVDYLAEYKPDKIALEWEKSEEDELIAAYQKRKENYATDEVEQIGFRLAKKLNHDTLHAVNWQGAISQEDLMKLHAEIQSSYPALMNFIDKLSENTPEISLDTSLIDSYRELNDEQSMKELEEMYLSFVKVTDPAGENIGFDFLNKWMERELVIFKNVTEMSDPEERILLIIGSDHLWMLNNLFKGNGWSVINPFYRG